MRISCGCRLRDGRLQNRGRLRIPDVVPGRVTQKRQLAQLVRAARRAASLRRISVQ
jgi:hypothetical protein